MKTSTIIILGSVAAIGIGAAVFLSTREAAASEKAKKAFEIDKDCSVIRVVDEAAFQAAVRDAALASYNGTDEQADVLLDRALSVLLKEFPQCPERLGGTVIFQVPNQLPMPLAVVRAVTAGKTVGELRDAYARGDFNLEGAAAGAASTLRDRITNSLFGEGI